MEKRKLCNMLTHSYTLRNRVPQGALVRLERYESKDSRTVLRGGDGGNAVSLPDTSRKANDMFKGLLPPQQCRWCKNSLDAGEMTCQVCRGNRLAPRRWWPVTAASLLLLVFTLCAMGILLVAIRTADGTPAASVSPVATPAGAGQRASRPFQHKHPRLRKPYHPHPPRPANPRIRRR